jgi:hypothetical protein
MTSGCGGGLLRYACWRSVQSDDDF